MSVYLKNYTSGNKELMVVYDIEVLKTYFSIIMQNVEDESLIYKYECYYTKEGDELNEIPKLIKFLNRKVGLMIGFNNHHYDYPMIKYILSLEQFIDYLSVKEILTMLYDKSQDVITNKSVYKTVPTECVITQIDIMELNNWNENGKWTSLKKTEFVMDFDNVQDMPFDHSHILNNKEEAREILMYNLNDVKATHLLYKKLEEEGAFKLRDDLYRIYGEELISSGEPEMGERIFGKLLSEDMGISVKELKKMRTHREVIDVGKDVILPYIKFETPQFKKLLEVYKKQKLVRLKEHFVDIGTDNPAYDLIKELSSESLKNKNGRIKKLNVEYKNHIYTYGSGGIHSKFEGVTYKANEEYVIWDLDVTSFYPMLAIKNGFRPGHLGEAFDRVYNGVFEQRLLFPKGTPENQILKIVLNSAYGKSSSPYSFLYDILMTAKICINGQLLLTMLIEQMILKCKAECIMANTDGATFYLKRKDLDKANKIAKEWEELTKLSLEKNEYKAQYYRDVNNYLWIGVDGKNKLKGCFEYFEKPKMADYSRDFSMRIVAEACVKQITNGTPYYKTINDCNVIEKFFIGVKVQKGDRLYTKEWSKEESKFIETDLSKFTRYYIANPELSNKKLWKQMSNVDKTPKKNSLIYSMFDDLEEEVQVERHSTFNKDWNVLIANDKRGHTIDMVDKQYYKEECKKILDSITL